MAQAKMAKGNFDVDLEPFLNVRHSHSALSLLLNFSCVFTKQCNGRDLSMCLAEFKCAPLCCALDVNLVDSSVKWLYFWSLK